MSAHTLTVSFDDGETEYVTLTCHLTGPDRPCAIIDCPVDHEDTSRECIEAHGAKALDECWAEVWYEAGGRETLNTEVLDPITIPVHVIFDEGVYVENSELRNQLPALLAVVEAARELANQPCRKHPQAEYPCGKCDACNFYRALSRLEATQ